MCRSCVFTFSLCRISRYQPVHFLERTTQYPVSDREDINPEEYSKICSTGLLNGECLPFLIVTHQMHIRRCRRLVELVLEYLICVINRWLNCVRLGVDKSFLKIVYNISLDLTQRFFNFFDRRPLKVLWVVARTGKISETDNCMDKRNSI